MRRHGPAVLLALVGAAVLRVSLFGDLYLRYVQPGLRPYLVVSGAGLVLLAVAAAVAAGRGGPPGAEHADGQGHGGQDRDDRDNEDHAHGHGPAAPRAAWLLCPPALALLLFPPPALGSYSAEREAAQRVARGVGTFPALPSGDPVELTVGEFGSRAAYDSERSLRGRTVRLTGFVTRDADGTWYVTRLLVACCAADAATARAEIRGGTAPPADTWVTVTGTWHPRGEPGSGTAWPPVLDAAAVRRVEAPANPYERR